MEKFAVPSSVVPVGLGAYLPERVLSNDDLAQRVDTSHEWIVARTGICQRHIAAEGETAASMATLAGKEALADAQLEPSDIGLLVLATMSADTPFPATACYVQAKLGLPCGPALDVSAACTGFLYALEVAVGMMRVGAYRHALVIGTEKMSSLLDWEDRSTCVLFGDGAGAMVLSACSESGVGYLASLLQADGRGAAWLRMPAGGCLRPPSIQTVERREHFLKMDGREIFRFAVRKGIENMEALLKREALSADEVACFVPHQANIRIIESLAERFKLPMERFFVNIDRVGNTSAASVPIALKEARDKGRFKKGDLVLLVAFGAGLTWGSTLLKWAYE